MSADWITIACMVVGIGFAMYCAHRSHRAYTMVDKLMTAPIPMITAAQDHLLFLLTETAAISAAERLQFEAEMAGQRQAFVTNVEYRMEVFGKLAAKESIDRIVDLVMSIDPATTTRSQVEYLVFEAIADR